MFDDFASEVLAANVTSRSGNMKNCQALAVITGIKEQKTRDGQMGIVELLLVKVTPRDPNNTNVVGEKIARTYPLYGSADKRSFFAGLLKKDMCHLADLDFKKLTADQWKAVGAAAGAGSFNGMLVSLDPYDFETNGSARIGHNIVKVPGKNAPTDVLKRSDALAKGAGAETFL